MLRKLWHALVLAVYLGILVGPAWFVDASFTHPALEAECATRCTDRGEVFARYERGWTRGHPDVCHCVRAGAATAEEFHATTWWVVPEIALFLAAIWPGMMFVAWAAPELAR